MTTPPAIRPIFALCACLAWGSGVAIAAESGEMHPLAADVAEQLGDAANSEFVMVVLFETPEGGGEALIEAMAEPTRGTLTEPGNLAYALSRDAENPRRFVLYERWKNVAALDAHMRQPYLEQLQKDFATVLAKPPGVTVYHPVKFD